jgi:hypothetical protein
MENVMSTKTRLWQEILFPFVLLLLLLSVLIACDRWNVTIMPASTDTPRPVPALTNTPIRILPPGVPTRVSPPTSVPGTNPTSAVVVFTSGTTETGRQTVNLGRQQPGRYTLELANANPPQSGHWLEWDYLALKAGDGFIWQIGQDETPPDYTERATDEFCNASVRTDCKTEFMVVAGKVDEGNFPKTLNDGTVPAIRITFILTQDRATADLVLTLSTLYSSHTNPDVKEFKMRVTLQGPF